MSEKRLVPLELGDEKISKLLKKYALPAIIAMTASSLYNMVDSIFIGNGVGPLAISGLAVTFPLMNLSTAFGTLVGVGAATMISVFLGQHNYKAANKVLGNLLTLNIIISLLFMVAALVFIDPILYFFGASENTVGYAREYMRIILYGNLITHVYFGLNGAMRSSGNPKKAMTLTLMTVCINTALDPLFIFTFGMGIKGAAIATVLSQLIAMTVEILHFSGGKKLLHFSRQTLKPDFRVARDSLSIGFGPFLMNSAACLVTLFINQQLLKYIGDLGIGAYGIINRITYLFVMICMGITQGMQPIAGYNYGARKYSRVKAVYSQSVIWATFVCILCFVLSEFFPETAVSLFTVDSRLKELAVLGLQITNITFPIVGFQIISTNFFQCLGMINKNILLSVSRQVLLLLPLLYTVPMLLGENGIWTSFPISDFLAFIMTVIMVISVSGKFKKLNDGDDPGILGSKL